jgi:hypothetical protein
LADAGAAGVVADAIGSFLATETLSVGTGLGTLEWTTAVLRAGWETSIESAMRRPGIG